MHDGICSSLMLTLTPRMVIVTNFKMSVADSVDPDQTAPLGPFKIWIHTVCLYAEISH